MDVDQPPAGETEMETDHQLPSIAAVKRLLGPRERLEKLLVDRHVRQGAQEMEDEILRLARENPEVFYREGEATSKGKSSLSVELSHGT